jgi:hypothetical protein
MKLKNGSIDTMIKCNTARLLSLAVASAFASTSAFADDNSFFTHWLDNVSQTQENQPHWMTPLVTVTPRLEQEFRFDVSHADKPKGVRLDNYGGGKGLELIPSENTEIIVGMPAYQDQSTPKASSTGTGWGDENLLLKYRIISANEEHGNYIVSAFLGVSLPSGSDLFSNHHTIITPTLAAGKGWGDRDAGVDVQSTLGISLPTAGADGPTGLGRPLTWNTALQGHVGKFWPEIETSYTHWYDGALAGKDQLIVTYGTTLGRFEIEKRVKAIVGVGYQTVQGTREVNLNHGILATLRITF